MRVKLIKSKLFSLFLLIFFASCAPAPVSKVIQPPTQIRTEVPPVERQDLVHTVGPGETIWRIAKMYDVPEDTVVQRNRISDPSRIEKGQRLFIPKAAPIRPVITLYKTNKWRYIIIHHSGTDVGSALAFDRYHNLRGFAGGLGYHFVIDNGTKGKFDGQIEVSPRWLNKQDGAHCRASGMNSKAIGICLVGNFNYSRPTDKQLDSLVYLVNRLRRYYNIPISNIVGHGQVLGAQTDCPGTQFPWARFWSLLERN